MFLTHFLALISLSLAFDSQLPFFLYASNQVPEIGFTESTCVFVQTFAEFNVSSVVFTPKNADGSVGESVSAGENLTDVDSGNKVLLGLSCFESDVKSLLVDYGSTFDGIDSKSKFWNSAIFYFMSKAKVEGVCKDRGFLGGNVHAFHSDLKAQLLSFHAECPAVILATTGFTTVSTITFDTEQNTYPMMPANARLDVSDVRFGLANGTHLSLISLTRDNTLNYNGETFLTSALMISSNRSVWSENALSVSGSFADYSGEDNEVCHVDRLVQFDSAGGYDGLIVTNPFNPIRIVHLYPRLRYSVELAGTANNIFKPTSRVITVEVNQSYFYCAEFAFRWTDDQYFWHNVSLTRAKPTIRLVETTFQGFRLAITLRPTRDCEAAFLKIPYSIRSATMTTSTMSTSTWPTTVAPTSTGTAATSMEPLTTVTATSPFSTPSTNPTTAAFSTIPTILTTVTPTAASQMTTGVTTNKPFTPPTTVSSSTTSTSLTSSSNSPTSTAPSSIGIPTITVRSPTSSTVTSTVHRTESTLASTVPTTTVSMSTSTASTTVASTSPIPSTVGPPSSINTRSTAPTTVSSNTTYSSTLSTVTSTATSTNPQTTKSTSTSTSTVPVTPKQSTSTTSRSTTSTATVPSSTLSAAKTTKTTSREPLRATSTTVTSTTHQTTTPKSGSSVKNSILPRILCSILVILYVGF